MTTITDKLAEAIELAEDAMAYVPEYFANKHGMNRRMAALKEEFAALASQQADKPHLFELWWERYMPSATQAEAWEAWQAAPRADGVGVASRQAEQEANQ